MQGNGLAQMTYDAYRHVTDNGHWNGKTCIVNSQLDKPSQWKKPRMIFVCSMGDLFHENVSSLELDAVFDEIYRAPQHIYIILTKRPENIRKYIEECAKEAGVDYEELVGSPKSNILWGVTAENQKTANERIPILMQIPVTNHFVSIEPMLWPVDLKSIIFRMPDGYGEFVYDTLTGTVFSDGDSHKLDWVICGGESGPKARPLHPEWARSLRDQCQAAQVPFFFKQWGEWLPSYNCGERSEELAANGKTIGQKWSGNNCNRFDDGQTVVKVGRKAAGHLLDGKQLFEFPKGGNQ